MIEYESLEASNRSVVPELRAAFERVLARGWYVLGSEVSEFEREFAEVIGAAHCIGVGNGMDALTLSIRALDLPAASEILVASNTYIATILAILQAGHVPMLVEPDPRTYNIDPARLAASATHRTRAICVTHLYGKTCRMDAIMKFAVERGLEVIEDCAQSHLAKLNGKTTGTFGAAGCFSFYPTKNLGALGDGGAIVTDRADVAEKLRHLRNYGSRQKYVNTYIGTNSRLDELQAAFLRAKLKHLPEVTAHKQRLAAIYFAELPGDVILPLREADTEDVFHIFAIRTERRDELKAFLLEKGIRSEIHYPIPPHRQKAMEGILSGDYPIADVVHAQELSLPISIGTTDEQVRQVCQVVSHFFQK